MYFPGVKQSFGPLWQVIGLTLDVDGRIILKWIIKKWDVGHGLD
jgi:hypothetical protein